MSEMRGLIPGGQNGAHSGVGHDPGSIKNGKVPEECGAVVARAAALRDFQEVIQGLGEEEHGQEVVQPMVEENWAVPAIEEEEEGDEEQEVEGNEQEDEEDEVEEDENEEDEDDEEGEEWMDEREESGHDDYDNGEDEEEGEEDSYGGKNENYMDREEEENGKEGMQKSWWASVSSSWRGFGPSSGIWSFPSTPCPL